jgi:uncharacterized protein (TIGR02246 family)
MRRAFFGISIGLLLIPALIGARSPARASDVDAELKELIIELDSRWNARDAEGMSKLFAPHVDFRIYGSNQYRSRDEFRLHYEEAFSTRVPADVRHTTSLQSIRVLASGVAVLDGEVEVGKPGAAQSDLRQFYYTAVVTKEGGTWVFDTFRVAPKLKESLPSQDSKH